MVNTVTTEPSINRATHAVPTMSNGVHRHRKHGSFCRHENQFSLRQKDPCCPSDKLGMPSWTTSSTNYKRLVSIARGFSQDERCAKDAIGDNTDFLSIQS